MNAFLIVCAIPWAAVGLSSDLGTAKSKNATLREALFSGNHNLNWLSFARLFLFASRDLWFEVPLPFYLRAPACGDVGRVCLPPLLPGDEATCPYGGTTCVDGMCVNINDGGGCGGLGLDRVFVGTFLALYIVVYGQMQAAVPWLVLQPLRQAPPNKYAEIVWGFINLVPTLFLWCIALWGPWFIDNIWRDKLITMITGIAFFALIFAVNSSIHRQVHVDMHTCTLAHAKRMHTCTLTCTPAHKNRCTKREKFSDGVSRPSSHVPYFPIEIPAQALHDRLNSIQFDAIGLQACTAHRPPLLPLTRAPTPLTVTSWYDMPRGIR